MLHVTGSSSEGLPRQARWLIHPWANISVSPSVTRRINPTSQLYVSLHKGQHASWNVPQPKAQCSFYTKLAGRAVLMLHVNAVRCYGASADQFPSCRTADCGSGEVVTVKGMKYEMLNSAGMRLELQYPAVVTFVGMKYEISDSVTVALGAPGEELGSLCWGIRLSQSEPFHIIGQGHLLSSRSGEAFPTNATQLARSSILCFTTLLFSLQHCHLSFSPLFFLLASYSSAI